MKGLRHLVVLIPLLLAAAWPAAPLIAQPGESDMGDADVGALAEYHTQSRAVVEQVLANEEFENLTAANDEWLERWIEQLRQFFQDLRSGIDQLPVWVHQIIIAWMLITLVAVLLHLIYTLWQSLRSEGGRKGLSDTSERAAEAGLMGIRELDFDAVFARAMTLLESERFEQAVRHLYAAAILHLDLHGRLHFAPAKTNGDYLQELAPGDPAHQPLQQMTWQFEATVFGRRSVDRAATDVMVRALAAIREPESNQSAHPQESTS